MLMHVRAAGKPKGVMIRHDSFADFVRNCQTAFELTSQDHWLLTISISFDPHIMEVRMNLCLQQLQQNTTWLPLECASQLIMRQR